MNSGFDVISLTPPTMLEMKKRRTQTPCGKPGFAEGTSSIIPGPWLEPPVSTLEARLDGGQSNIWSSCPHGNQPHLLFLQGACLGQPSQGMTPHSIERSWTLLIHFPCMHVVGMEKRERQGDNQGQQKGDQKIEEKRTDQGGRKRKKRKSKPERVVNKETIASP